MTALTYEEAKERSRLLNIRGYRVELDVAAGDEVFGSITVVRFGCRVPGAGSFVELEPARLRRAVLNGRDIDPAALTGNRLPLADLHDDNELRVEADMPYSRTGAGLHRFTDTADGETYLAVHGGLDNAQRLFAAFDQPDLKAPIAAAVTASENWTVIGNGRARPAGHGRWELAATPPISTYLFTLVAGPYVSISTEHRGVPFGLHARQSLAGPLHQDAAEIFGITLACFVALADLTSLCRDLLSARPSGRASEAGGAGRGDEMRLVAARGLIDSAAGPDDISALRSWLAAGRAPGGPDLDSRLRWQILLRLAVLGAASRAEIEDDADRDSTAAARLSAARCRAALPDHDAKQAAWAAMRSGTLSGYELTATAQGFWQADQAELLDGYVPRYFGALADAAAAGAADQARAWCRHGFPHHAVDAGTVRAAERCLETGALGGSLRRLLADQVEDLRRALAVRSGMW